MQGARVIPKVKLGSSNLNVTRVCLGTMTWGMQNTEEQAHQQLDYAIKERGVNFIDTAEMYPVPRDAPGWVPGTTERYIGTWLAKNPEWRKKIVLATKVAGFMGSNELLLGRLEDKSSAPVGVVHVDYNSVKQACNASLRKLQTDYIDLYQIHWPDRYIPSFGATVYDASKERPSTPFKETLLAIKELIEEGKVLYYGVSNETTWGLTELCHVADSIGAPRPVSIQNSFSLLHRSFETELAEACSPSHLNIGLLPWSALGGGALTGKYLNGKNPPNCRFTQFSNFQTRYINERSKIATQKYQKIAEKANISLATLALAFCNAKWYVSSTIIGATTLEQLKENIDAFEVTLSKEILDEIDQVHLDCRDPSQEL